MKNNLPDIVVFIYILYFIIVGLSLQPFDELFHGIHSIQTSSGVLISDYMLIGDIGPTLVNGAIVGLLGFIILKINSVPMTGMSIAAVFTMLGFGFFGKNMWSIFPTILGVYIYSKINKKKFNQYIYPALFSTCLAPLVTYYAFETSLGIFGGILIGIIAGIIIPPLATRLLNLHEGYDLYNVGFAGGFVALLLYNILKGYGFVSDGESIWATELNSLIRPIIIPVVISMIIIGFIINKKSPGDFKEIFKHPGVLVTDYVSIAGFGNTLINMGLVGLIAIIYIELVKGPYNGGTLAGILTIVGFGASGKNPLNIIPLMLGVYIGTIFSIYEANAPGPLLAALFSTGIAPIAGKFGPIVGILAGFVHLSIVSNTGDLYGGLNLYNNGFAGGIVATIFIAIYEGFNKDS